MWKESKEPFATVDLTSHMTEDELRDKIQILENEVHKSQIDAQTCLQKLEQIQSEQTPVNRIERLLNPLSQPEREYVNRLGSRNNGNQMIGFLYNESERYPLFGRPKYPGRTEKWEYYLIDDSRNKLKIPFKTRNDEEISEGDDVYIRHLDKTYKVELYDYQESRYNPW